MSAITLSDISRGKHLADNKKMPSPKLPDTPKVSGIVYALFTHLVVVKK